MAGVSLSLSQHAGAQDAPVSQSEQHDHMQTPMPSTGWQFMQDGLFRVTFNHQGSDRGGNDLVAPNWWMGMASRTAAGAN